ncbi:MAG: DUF3145 family protein, partial [Sciscionella sp.]|nr:DUF3145 family protein [Sciscionella sp.]
MFDDRGRRGRRPSITVVEQRRSAVSTTNNARGVVYVHSAPPAVCPHVEWAISGTLGMRADLQWSAQSAAAGQLRAECAWSGEPGSGARLSSALRAWPMIRFEVTEDPSAGLDGQRFCYAPGLGLWHAQTSASGDIVVG